MINDKKIDPFNLKKSISDDLSTISRQTNLGPKDFTTSKNYYNNLPERNISLGAIVRAYNLYKGGSGADNIVVINEDKYLMTESGLFLLTEAEKIILAENQTP